MKPSAVAAVAFGSPGSQGTRQGFAQQALWMRPSWLGGHLSQRYGSEMFRMG